MSKVPKHITEKFGINKSKLISLSLSLSLSQLFDSQTSLVPHPAKSFDFCEEYVENSLKNQIDHGVEVKYQRRESQCENLKRESGGEERYGGVRRRSETAVRLAVIKRWLMFSKRSPFLELMSYYMMISSRGVVVGESDSGGRLCRRGPICNRLSNWSFICSCTASLDKGFGSGTWSSSLPSATFLAFSFTILVISCCPTEGKTALSMIHNNLSSSSSIGSLSKQQT
ncbi:hypothetical protein CsSME_00050809 [Camellia sinensis var. sinensis]